MERVCTWQPSVPQCQGLLGFHSLGCREWTGAFGAGRTPHGPHIQMAGWQPPPHPGQVDGHPVV